MVGVLGSTGRVSRFAQFPPQLIERADNEDVQNASMSICRLFGVGKNGTVTYKQPDEDESTLANVWFDHPQTQFYLKSTFTDWIGYLRVLTLLQLQLTEEGFTGHFQPTESGLS